MNTTKTLLSLLIITIFGCQSTSPDNTSKATPFTPKSAFSWNNANVYFLLTDRFHNGNTDNDVVLGRQPDGATLRYFMGGDLKGITQKINEGYFSDLGISAIWLTPFVEQIHSFTDEGTGKTYGFHGYWAKDWTSVDPNFGTEEELAEMVEAAHGKGIRILMDAVLNHTGPVTDTDKQWPNEWVRTSPTCDFQNYEGTTSCTLVENLPDVRTDSDEAVELPAFLKTKWQAEGRLEKEIQELDAFFARTDYPRAARFYIVKWLTDWVRKYGIDGFRVDTAKHTEETVWGELKKEAIIAFQDWKKTHPDAVLDEQDFFMTGEVYGYGAPGGRNFDFGDKKVDFFNHGFESLINFSFKYDAKKSPEELFSMYSKLLNGGSLEGVSVLNYLSSHDDGDPFDQSRTKALEAGTKLLLSPGSSQVYYGDETSRPLNIEDAAGDAKLRSFMNWEDVSDASEVLAHWSKLGRFRRDHISVGVGSHEMLTNMPYVFKRTYEKNGLADRVVVALDLDTSKGTHEIDVSSVFIDGVTLTDYYSDTEYIVENGKVNVSTSFDIILLAVKG